MFTLEELSRQIAACNNGSSTIQQFVDWFEDNCAGAYETESLSDAAVAVDAALSEYRYDEIDEDVLKEELAGAVRPFALSELYVLSFDVSFDAPKRPKALTAALACVLSVPLVAPVQQGTLSALNGSRVFVSAAASEGASIVTASTSSSIPALVVQEVAVQ
jgi:hypothetical protein